MGRARVECDRLSVHFNMRRFCPSKEPMNQPSDDVTRALGVVDHTLRDTFPGTHWKRCTYGAAGLDRLLSKRGIDTIFSLEMS